MQKYGIVQYQKITFNRKIWLSMALSSIDKPKLNFGAAYTILHTIISHHANFFYKRAKNEYPFKVGT